MLIPRPETARQKTVFRLRAIRRAVRSRGHCPQGFQHCLRLLPAVHPEPDLKGQDGRDFLQKTRRPGRHQAFGFAQGLLLHFQPLCLQADQLQAGIRRPPVLIPQQASIPDISAAVSVVGGTVIARKTGDPRQGILGIRQQHGFLLSRAAAFQTVFQLCPRRFRSGHVPAQQHLLRLSIVFPERKLFRGRRPADHRGHRQKTERPQNPVLFQTVYPFSGPSG